MAELALRLLLAPLDRLLTSTENTLNPCRGIKNHAECCSHVYTLLVCIIVQVLPGEITLVPVNEVDFIGLSGRFGIDARFHVRLFYCAEPRFTSHELVAKLRWVHKEIIVARQPFTLLLISHYRITLFALLCRTWVV